MIKFGHIILEAGLNPKDFQRISEIPVKLFDRKNREIKDEKFFDFSKAKKENYFLSSSLSFLIIILHNLQL